MLRWYDHWLKGLDTGILDDPPVRFWVMGANEWRSGSDWPLPETEWVKFYLRGWERLTTEPFVPASADDYQAPDAFVQMPASQTNDIQKLRYLSEPLAEDVTIAGPSVLNLYAAIDQDDTNWIVILKDVGPDVGVQTAREGERDITAGLHERELTRGWLKASHRALDPARSLPGRPWHPLTRAAQKPVVPGEINEYAIEIMATANQFKRGHRICVEITSLDLATGVGERHQRRVHSVPHLQQQDRSAPVFHDPAASFASAASSHPQRMKVLQAMPTITMHNPANMGKPLGQYSQITRVKASEFLFIAGQVATDANGSAIGRRRFRRPMPAGVHQYRCGAQIPRRGLCECRRVHDLSRALAGYRRVHGLSAARVSAHVPERTLSSKHASDCRPPRYGAISNRGSHRRRVVSCVC